MGELSIHNRYSTCMNQDEKINTLVAAFSPSLRENEFEEKRLALAAALNRLLQSDFQKLVSLLYRIDISESKLKFLLKEHPSTDAALIIADLVIERQLQKLRSKQQYPPSGNNIDEKEKW